MDEQNKLIVEFARLWGQAEATVYTSEDEDISDVLKSYDSKGRLALLTKWAKGYNGSGEKIRDYFEAKVKGLCEECLSKIG